MNWDAIAAIAEALGAVGVIATVIYLAFQIRQNTKSIQGSTGQSLMSQEMGLYALIAEHASVYRRGCANLTDLDSDETVVFEYLVSAEQSQLYSAYVQFNRNHISESLWRSYIADWTDKLQKPGFQVLWEDIKHAYPDEFCQSLDEIKKNSMVAA